MWRKEKAVGEKLTSSAHSTNVFCRRSLLRPADSRIHNDAAPTHQHKGHKSFVRGAGAHSILKEGLDFRSAGGATPAHLRPEGATTLRMVPVHRQSG